MQSLFLAAALLLAAEQPVATGVAVPVALVGALSSVNVHAGQSFRFRTTADVHDGDLVIPAGTPGYGIIKAAQPGSHGVKTSTLDLEPQALQLAGGTTLAVTASPASEATLNQTRHAAGVPVPIFAGPIILMGVGHQAHDVTLADGTPFTVIVSR
jgi:hypothetical protein